MHSKRLFHAPLALSLTLSGIEIQSVYPVTLVSRVMKKECKGRRSDRREREMRSDHSFDSKNSLNTSCEKRFGNCVLMSTNFYANHNDANK